ncbi:MAG TPA: hypothetical protein VFL78_00390 [Rhodanobacteraceae bacterium]|nr:hypothetical protein [Rhodanobacteraceae bacterium]
MLDEVLQAMGATDFQDLSAAPDKGGGDPTIGNAAHLAKLPKVPPYPGT